MNNKKDWLPDPASWKGTWREDWRIMGQEGYLMGKTLQHRRFQQALSVDDFTQCEFCWACFDEDGNNSSMAYFEPINKVWICEKCFHDFLNYFNWSVETEKGNTGDCFVC